MLTSYSNLGNAKLVAPINGYSYIIHIRHIVFSIDMPFLALQNLFCTKWSCTWWKAVHVAFLCIKTFGRQLQESAFQPVHCIAIKKSANVIRHVPREISAACSIFIQRGGILTCIIIDSRCQYLVDLPASLNSSVTMLLMN